MQRERATRAQVFDPQGHLWLLSWVWNCKQYCDWEEERRGEEASSTLYSSLKWQTLVQRSSCTWHSELTTLMSKPRYTDEQKRKDYKSRRACYSTPFVWDQHTGCLIQSSKWHGFSPVISKVTLWYWIRLTIYQCLSSENNIERERLEEINK